MDPKYAMDVINDPNESDSRRIEAVGDLALWLHKGGFVPNEVGNISDQAVDDLREFTGDIILSVRVCIEYGDYSGLEYSFSS
jgi:hypothetical protein